MSKLNNYIHDNHNNYVGRVKLEAHDKLPPGIYELGYNADRDEVVFQKFKNEHDSLLDLPSKEYSSLVAELEHFMLPETKVKFEQNGFLYKRSAILWGAAGTGKSCLINRIANKVIDLQGVVLFNPDPRILPKAFKVLTEIEPETRVMVIFEEFDETIRRFEEQMLSILDGEVQKANVIYMAATNNIEKIPARIRRPGRFSSVVEIKFPDELARNHYLKVKLPDMTKEDRAEWVSKTEGLSIDELKETVLAVVCLGQDLEAVVVRIRENKGHSASVSKDFEADMIEKAVKQLSVRFIS